MSQTDGMDSFSSNRNRQITQMIKSGKLSCHLGGTVAEWSKALQLREKINENQKIPGSPPPPAWATFKKLSYHLLPDRERNIKEELELNPSPHGSLYPLVDDQDSSSPLCQDVKLFLANNWKAVMLCTITLNTIIYWLARTQRKKPEALSPKKLQLYKRVRNPKPKRKMASFREKKLLEIRNVFGPKQKRLAAIVATMGIMETIFYNSDDWTRPL